MGDETGPSELPQHVLDFLAEQKTLTLATASRSGTPHAATLLYANEAQTIYLWLRPSSTTARRLEENPVVSFAIDAYSEDWRQTRGLQGVGECRAVSGEDIAKVAMLFGERFPAVTPSGSTANISFYRIDPTELLFIDNTGEHERTDEFGFAYRRDRVYEAETPAEGGAP